MSGIDASITNLVAAQRGALSSKISYAVAAKQLDAAEQQGEAVLSLLDGAAQLGKAVGKGDHVDAQA